MDIERALNEFGSKQGVSGGNGVTTYAPEVTRTSGRMRGRKNLENFEKVFIGVSGLALIYGLWVWRTTSTTDPEFPIRKNQALLTLVLFLGAISSAIRSRFSVSPTSLLIGTAMMLPLVGMAIFLCWRLLKAYQNQPKTPKS